MFLEDLLPNLSSVEDKSCPFKNCLRNNYRHLRKWAKRTQTDCFRVYDRDIKEFPLAIDLYADRFCIHYFAPTRAEEEPKAELYGRTMEALQSLFGATESRVHWRLRIRRERTEQYEKTAASKEFFVVHEYGVKFWVNLADYLDTGLFLDHRETRRYVASIARGKRLLNLFAYTCSFSVHAAVSGAAFTKSVDLSNTYTAWGRDNFILNDLPQEPHPILREDCMKFLEEERELYDLIVIDPPTLSRSKKMDGMFDVQQDYLFLISKAVRLLTSGGVLFFSTNARTFVFDESQFPGCSILDVSKKTLPLDFRDPKIHYCWRISRE